MAESSVQFKGVNGDLRLSLDWTQPVDTLFDQLTVELQSSNNFFSGSRVVLELGRRPITLNEVQSFQDLLARYQMVLHALCGGLSEEFTPSVPMEPAIIRPAEDPLALPQTRQDSLSFSKATHAAEPPLREGPRDRGVGRLLRTNGRIPAGDARGYGKTLMAKRTLRSGQILQYAGSIILIGDVNPGAEVAAGHDVVIWGSLRGTACAGVSGDTDAGIYALHMAPSQLRIADHITRSPRDNQFSSEGQDLRPEVARIESATIIVEDWHTKRNPPAKVLTRVSQANAPAKSSKG